MGTTKSKTVDKISYRSRLFPSLVTIDLNESFDYPQRPKKTELNCQFKQILQEIEIVSEEKSMLENFPKSLKWKLICRHRDYVLHNLSSIPEVDKSEAQLMIEQLKETSSLQDLRNLNSWLPTASKEEVESFYEFSGLKVLIEILQVSELCSRTQGSFYKQIEILKAVLVLVKSFGGSREVIKIPRSISILFLNFNEIQLEVTALMLEVMGYLLWETENDGGTLNAIFEAIERYKNENGLNERLDVFVQICKCSKNIMFIENILGFIIALISAPLDLDKRRALKAEFVSCGIESALQSVKEKVTKKEYQIQDCSYLAMKDALEERKKESSKFFTKTFTISEFANQDEKVEDYEKYASERLKYKNKNYLDDLMKFQSQKKLSFSLMENHEKEDKKLRKSPTTIIEKTYYLSECDTELFEEHLKTVLSQIEAFEKGEDEAGNKEKPFDFNNPLVLFNELKEHAKKIESYPQLIMILQKLASINQKSIYISLEEIVLYLKELSDQNPKFEVPPNFNRILKDSQKYQELETKFEALQLSNINQEKMLAKLRLEKEKNQESMLNSIPIGSTTTTINMNNPTGEGIAVNNTKVVENVPPAPNILPPPLVNVLKEGGIALLGPPAPNLLKMPGLPPVNLLNLGKKPDVPVKEKKKPNVALKALMWSTVNPSKIKETIWEKIDDNKVPLDVQTIEREFLAATKAKIHNEKEEDSKKKEENLKVSLLPPEKSKNLEIVLGKLKLDLESFPLSLLSCDDTSLSLDKVEALINVIPSEAEMKVVRDYEGERDSLANPEKFISILQNVPGFFERLNAMRFSKIYEELMEDLENKLETLTKVWGGIQNNNLFKGLLEHILAIGNYLNGTSVRGGAFGFKLDSLEKLSDLKTSDGKKNLLCYVIETMEKEKLTKVIDENMDLSDFDLAAKLPISQLWTDLGEIRKGSKFIFGAIQQKTNEKEDKIEEKMEPLAMKLEKIIKNFEDRISNCEKLYESCANFLCENPKDSSEKMGEKIFKFWLSCRNAKRMILKFEELVKKQEEKEKNKALQENKTLRTMATTKETTNTSKVLQKYDIGKDAKPFGMMRPGDGGNQILEAIKHKRISKILKSEEKK